MANGPSCGTIGIIVGLFAAAVVIGTVCGLIPLYIQGSSSTSGKTSASVSGGSTTQTTNTGRGILGRAVSVNGNSINTLTNYESSGKTLLGNVLILYSLSVVYSYTYSGSTLSAAPIFTIYSNMYSLSMDTVSSAMVASQSASGTDTVGTATITSWTATTSCTFSITGISATAQSGSNYAVTQYSGCAYTCKAAQPTNTACISTYTANSSTLASILTTPSSPTTTTSGSGSG